jgi:hypothetical protein
VAAARWWAATRGTAAPVVVTAIPTTRRGRGRHISVSATSFPPALSFLFPLLALLVLFTAPEAFALLFLCLPFCLLGLHPLAFFFTLAVAFLTFNRPLTLQLFLLFAVKCITLYVAATCPKRTRHFGEFRLFRCSYSMRVGGLECFGVDRSCHSGQKLFTKFANFTFDDFFVLPVILKFELQLQAFNLHLSLALMLKNGLVRFTMFGRRSVPRSLAVSRCLWGSQMRQITLNIAVGSTSSGSSQPNAVVHSVCLG